MLCFVFGLSLLDRTNISAAYIAGLAQDLQLAIENRYNIALLVFFIGLYTQVDDHFQILMERQAMHCLNSHQTMSFVALVRAYGCHSSSLHGEHAFLAWASFTIGAS